MRKGWVLGPDPDSSHGINLSCEAESILRRLPSVVIPSLIPTLHNILPGGLPTSLDTMNSYLGGLDTPLLLPYLEGL